MSQFLGFESNLVPLGAAPADWHNLLRNILTNSSSNPTPGYGWTLVEDNLEGITQSITVPSSFVVCPPASEIIGSAQSRECVRFNIFSDHIGIAPAMQNLVAFPQRVLLWQGQDQPTDPIQITIDGHTITQSDANYHANTATKNLVEFFADLKNSNDSEISNWTWVLSRAPAQGGMDANCYIYGTRNVAEADVAVSSASPTGLMNHIYSSPFDPSADTANGCFRAAGTVVCYATDQILPIDLINGFIYYIQVNARGLAFGTRTNIGYYGPVHACYGDHATALQSIPIGISPFDISPIELLVGSDSASNSPVANATTAHAWVLNYRTAVGNPINNNDIYYLGLHPYSSFGHRDMMTDGSSILPYVPLATGIPIPLSASNLWNGTQTAAEDSFQIHRCALPNVYTLQFGYCDWIVPPIATTDWFKFTGTATNEALIVIADTITPYQLATPLDGTTNTSLINLASTAGMPSSGYVVLDAEIIQYGAISGNTLQGCNRAVYGTAMAQHWAEDQVYQALWLTVINGGALFCGYNKPS